MRSASQRHPPGLTSLGCPVCLSRKWAAVMALCRFPSAQYSMTSRVMEPSAVPPSLDTSLLQSVLAPSLLLLLAAGLGAGALPPAAPSGGAAPRAAALVDGWSSGWRAAGVPAWAMVGWLCPPPCCCCRALTMSCSSTYLAAPPRIGGKTGGAQRLAAAMRVCPQPATHAAAMDGQKSGSRAARGEQLSQCTVCVFALHTRGWSYADQRKKCAHAGPQPVAAADVAPHGDGKIGEARGDAGVVARHHVLTLLCHRRCGLRRGSAAGLAVGPTQKRAALQGTARCSAGWQAAAGQGRRIHSKDAAFAAGGTAAALPVLLHPPTPAATASPRSPVCPHPRNQ